MSDVERSTTPSAERKAKDLGCVHAHEAPPKEDGTASWSAVSSHPLPASKDPDADEINLADQCAAIERLFEERVRRGMQFWEWEEKSGVSTNAAFTWRRGRRAPMLGGLVALATAMGFEVILKKRAGQ